MAFDQRITIKNGKQEMTAKLPKNNQQTVSRKCIKTVEVWAMGERERKTEKE